MSETCDAMMKYTAINGCRDCQAIGIDSPCDVEVPDYIPDEQIPKYVYLVIELEKKNV
jgi:hypothetical protein